MKNMNRKELASLVIKAQNKDREAFSRLYEYTHSAQFFTALSILKSREQAEEAVQTVYMLALDKLCNLRAPEAFLTWLTQINYNHCLYLSRQTSRKQEPLDEETLTNRPDPSPDKYPEECAIQSEKQNAVLRIIGSLSEEHRMVILLKYYHNRKLKEIAKIMNCSLGTVKSRLHYAQRELKKQLSCLGIESSSDFYGIGLLISSALHFAGGEPKVNISVDKRNYTPLVLTLTALLLLVGIGSAQKAETPVVSAVQKDEEPPSVTSYRYEKGALYFTLEDDISGLDVMRLNAQAENGESVPVESYDRIPGHFRIECSPGQMVSIYVTDLSGNSTEYQVETGYFYSTCPDD